MHHIKLSRIISSKIIIFFLLFYITILQSAEILYEKDWSRIISGDNATQLTRGVNLIPYPHKINEKILTKIFNKIDFSDQSAKQLKAWQKGLLQYGWAQFENEPEKNKYQAVQLVISGNKTPKLYVNYYTKSGLVLSACFTISGKQLSFKKNVLSEILDQSVFSTVRTAALFILKQEHFEKQFFEHILNLDYPGLEAVKKAYREGKILLAAHETAEYFRRKKHPVWDNSTPIKKAERDAAADKILRHEFSYGDSTIYMGKRIDYRNNPTNNTEWLWSLNHMRHWVTLLNGYKNTANEMYAQEFNRDVIDWTVRNPAPPFRLTRVPSWRNLDAGDRMAMSWPHSFFGFMASPSFQTQAVQLMLASIWSHGRHIEQFPSGLHFASNWSIVESNGLADLGMYFPEFKESEKWVNTGFQRLSNQMDLQIFPDGIQHELSPGYHHYCLRSFYRAYDVARKTGTPIPPNYIKTLEKMFEYLLYISTPARQVPPTNDSNSFNIRDWMQIGYDNFKRQDMLYIATNGQKGEPPKKTSILFPWGGHIVMRSDWSPNAWYLFFDAGPTGVNHQHEDKLHLDISAFGRIFLRDGGKGSYIPNKWRRYFISTQAHNTIIINGQGQQRIPQKETHRVANPMKNQWISNENIDFSSGTYSDGYGDKRIDVTHSRYVIFKKKEYWLIIDVLKGKGKHEFDALYHFTPCSLKTDIVQNSVATLFNDGRNIKISTAATVPLKTKIIEGAENPEQGWIALGSGKKAAPTAVFSGSTELPVMIATVIRPFTGEISSEIIIEIQKSADKQANVIVHFDQSDDQWIINLNKKNHIMLNGKDENAVVYFKRKEKGKETETLMVRFEE